MTRILNYVQKRRIAGGWPVLSLEDMPLCQALYLVPSMFVLSVLGPTEMDCWSLSGQI